MNVDKNIVLEEHKGVPRSYMEKQDLRSIIENSKELDDLLTEKDDLPQWASAKLNTAEDAIDSVNEYVKNEKTVTALIDTCHLFFKMASRYSHIDFVPPESVAKAAARGLELRKKNKGKGGLSTQQANKEGVGSGVARAVSLKNRKKLSPNTVKRMKAFFDRHEKNKKADKGKSLSEDKGYISHLLWGGDAGRSWANKIVKQMEAADKK